MNDVIHDNSVKGIHQDPLTGNVILGRPDVDFSNNSAVAIPIQGLENGKITQTYAPVISTTTYGTYDKVETPKVPEGMFDKMRYEVWKYATDHLDKSDHVDFPFNDDTVYVVWCCKTLQNWKALISTKLTDGMYYECTYNGDKDELYFDAYKKFEHRTIENFKG